MEKIFKEKEEIAEIREKALKLAIAEVEVVNKKREKDLQELDKTTKMLLRRDFELSKARERREEELEELKASKEALIKILKDVEEARSDAENEKNKTLAVINNFTDGLLIFDKQDNLLLVNPKAEEFLRIKKEDIIGKTFSELLKIKPLEQTLKLYKKETADTLRGELEIKEDLIIEVSVVEKLLILHDITRAKLVEKIKSEFVFFAAHQLRTPLSAVRWIFKMLLDGELGEFNEEQREFLEDGYTSNKRMINLVNDLLSVARIEEGRYLYDVTLVDIEKLFSPILFSFKEACKKKDIKFVFKKPSNKIPKVLVDTDKIKMVFENIIDNALNYTFPKGRVTISLKYSKREIEVSVKDTGMGIPENQRNNIFNKFFRAANVMRKDTEGTGLGLFISKNIIEAHNGKMWFESEENKGTTFYFTLPLEYSKIKL